MAWLYVKSNVMMLVWALQVAGTFMVFRAAAHTARLSSTASTLALMNDLSMIQGLEITLPGHIQQSGSGGLAGVNGERTEQRAWRPLRTWERNSALPFSPT